MLLVYRTITAASTICEWAWVRAMTTRGSEATRTASGSSRSQAVLKHNNPVRQKSDEPEQRTQRRTATTAVAAVSVKHGVCTRASAAESADSSPPHPLAGVHRVHYRPVAMKPGVNLAEHTDPRHRPVLKN